jgi:glycosyltransferase involved in cell wall biosynthesis
MLESLIGELGLYGCVTLHGAVGEEVVRARLESSSMFVLGSHDEAIGVATMEAMAMSLPVVVTRVGGVPELVRDEIDGLLVEPSNPAALAVAVQRIVNDPVLATRMGDSGCARVRERFGSQVSARAIADRLARPVSAGTGSA